MAKEKEAASASGLGTVVKTALSFVADAILPAVHARVDQVMAVVETRLVAVQRTLVKQLAAFVLVGLAFVSFLTALLFYLLESVHLSKSTVFAIVGAICLIGAYVLMQQNKVDALKRATQ
jgi:hypothetical protein